MLTNNQRDQLDLMCMFDDLFADKFDEKENKTQNKILEYCEYLKELCDACAQDYINDNDVEE